MQSALVVDSADRTYCGVRPDDAGYSKPFEIASLAGEVGYTESMKRIRAFLLAITVAWPALAAPPQPSLPSAVVPDGLGVNIHFTDARPGELEMLAAAGFHWVRMDFFWGGTEKRRGEYDFSAYDRLLAALEAQKLRALFILDYGNPLSPVLATFFHVRAPCASPSQCSSQDLANTSMLFADLRAVAYPTASQVW
jgi:hypothetical protein